MGTIIKIAIGVIIGEVIMELIPETTKIKVKYIIHKKCQETINTITNQYKKVVVK